MNRIDVPNIARRRLAPVYNHFTHAVAQRTGTSLCQKPCSQNEADVTFSYKKFDWTLCNRPSNQIMLYFYP